MPLLSSSWPRDKVSTVRVTMSKCAFALISLVLTSFVPLIAFSSPLDPAISGHEMANITYGHPSVETWRNATDEQLGRAPGMDMFPKIIFTPLPYGFIEFLRQGTTIFHHRQSLPTRFGSYLKDQWNRVATFMPSFTNRTSTSYITSNSTSISLPE